MAYRLLSHKKVYALFIIREHVTASHFELQMAKTRPSPCFVAVPASRPTGSSWHHRDSVVTLSLRFFRRKMRPREFTARGLPSSVVFAPTLVLFNTLIKSYAI